MSLIAVATFALVAAACSGTGPTDSPESTTADIGLPSTSRPVDGTGVVVLSGTIEVPAAEAFGDPGFHEAFTLTGTVPEPAAGVTGELVVRLVDAERPNQTCDRDHPLSGCVTIDWSDFEERPAVPDGGVFDNRLSIVSTAGPIDLFLSERRGLAATPDQYSPT